MSSGPEGLTASPAGPPRHAGAFARAGRVLDSMQAHAADRVWVRAPGRLNLIGEHTDYTGGFMLPIAVNLEIRGLAAPRRDGQVVVSSEGFGHDAFAIADPRPVTEDWRAYGRAVLAELRPHLGDEFGGMDLALTSELPAGAGLSSSAALEAAFALAALALAGRDLPRRKLAHLCRRAEHAGPQVTCGIMDHLAVLSTPQGSALLIDGRDGTARPVPFPVDRWRLVALDSGRARALAASAYHARQTECHRALAAIRTRFPTVSDLSDVTPAMLEQAALPSPLDRRVRHVIGENLRVMRVVLALREADPEALGAAMRASHASLRDDYEVSSPELDALATDALRSPHAVGSRLTGAGFGGCTVNVVAADGVDAFIDEVASRFEARFHRRPHAYAVDPAPPAAAGRLEV